MRGLYLEMVFWLLVLLMGITIISQKEKTIEGKRENTQYVEETKHKTINEIQSEIGQKRIMTARIHSDKVIEIPKKAVEETKETVKKSSNVASRGSYVNLDKEFTLTFYTSLADENGGYAGMNAMGGQLQYGQVASNVFSFGTQIYLEGYGTFKVADRGGSAFNKSNRLDVFIPRKQDESDSQYKKRVNDMGIQKVRGKILK